ncbi:FtsK/SpoIIIE domain-containing protein [Pseudarthrobacter sp. C4D7]|uniref:FtsK/SpoIIIE domain-containing protein n=1 Tax=Pseudarthrobacter sp. C4D7 TaxID=2735268 RepID=UPI00158545D9|nr:FtsK/SpoIIIE domain-containing protein [Pseudarthrobacter sp. C4D7]NUT70026.1 FHA domain-containing protein [Pseudarthrobacter sp. C4D7]
MTLNCTLVGSPGASPDHAPIELSIIAPTGTPGDMVHRHLAQKFRTGAVTVDGQDLRSLRLGVPPLVEGTVLVDGGTASSCGRPRRRQSIEAAPHLALAINSGAAAGTVVPLRRGSYTIGRSGTQIVIPDPELSREHARVVVTDTAILLVDLDSANGTYVDGERIRNTVISTASTITCGQSDLSLMFVEPPGGALADAGRSAAEPIVVRASADAGNRSVLILTAVLPLALGVLLAVITGMWMFLAFSAASALSVLIPAASGRRQKRAVSAAVRAAVEEDRERRRRSAPSLPLVALAAPGGVEAPDNVSGGGIWLRLGQTGQPANVRIEPAGTGPAIPLAGTVPVVLNPDRQLTTVGGQASAVDGAIRSFIMQLAGYPLACTTQVLVWGAPASLPLAARFLPRVTLAATPQAALSVISSPHPRGCERGVLLLRGEGSAGSSDDPVRDAAIRHGWQVIHFRPGEEELLPPDLLLSGHRSTLVQEHGDTVFVPDLVPENVFTSFCRRMAAERQKDEGEPASVPADCSLGDILQLTPAATANRWSSNGQKDGLAVPLGVSAAGIRSIDLQQDGPHLLVAGTTGSGKTELLRSLTIALALSYPPDRVNFFFIDFKGGSGLGPLSGFAHCVGLQTDLSTFEMERTLASLRAEVRLRESCLASARVPDLSAYRSTKAAEDFALPHLVIVIDEFRMLVDDAPEVLRELLRIASIGRSLGIHLIMATQRPQGALTADIRANVTSSIALRVQSEMESVDIVNCRGAAAISVDAPGRAFLARGTEAAAEFQCASLTSVATGAQPEPVSVLRTTDLLAGRTTGPGHAKIPLPTPAQAVEPLAAMVRGLCTEQEREAPRKPVAPPLPEKLEENPGGSAVPDSRLLESADRNSGFSLGLADVPDRQRVDALVWSPARHSHAAFIGGPASGARAALELAVRKLVAGTGETHFYILDAGGDFLPLVSAGRIGALAGLDDLRRGVRILQRMVRELGQRRSHPASAEVPLVLVISGWGSWVSAFRSGPLAWAEDLVQDLARDGAQAGITLLLSGERELVTARFFGALPNRFYFPAGSTEEGRAMWPRMPAMPSVEGRAAAFGPVVGPGPAVCQFYRTTASSANMSGAAFAPASLRPFRVDPLPAAINVAEVRALAALERELSVEVRPSQGPPASAHPAGMRIASAKPGDAVLGVAGDELAAQSLQIPASGVVAVLGNPGSGKSNTLRALEALNPGRKWCAHSGAHHDADDFWAGIVRHAGDGSLPRETILLVDDVDQLPASALKDLDHLHALGHSLVVTAAFSPVLYQRVPLLMTARSSGVGLLMGPRSVADGDLFGVRFDVESNPPPGRAALITGGRSTPLQVAWAGAEA